MKIFGLDAQPAAAERVAEFLGGELAAHEERIFEDSEFKIRPLESVRGEHAGVFYSLHADSGLSSSDKLCRLLIFAGALKDAGAARVTAVVPYLAYSRKDRRTKTRDPITTRYVAQMFEAVGVDAVITADVHNVAAFENAFRCVKENVSAARHIADHFLPVVVEASRIVVLSPDSGGVKRARAFSSLLAARLGRSVDLAFMEKYRSEGRVSGELFAGDVEKAFVIVIDDLISGGTTMARAARACRDRGAIEVHAAATHGLFAEDAAGKLGVPEIDSVVVTDTVPDALSRCPELAGKLIVLDTASLFADTLLRHDRPT
jgi:ribose-phosphate pyrophosphokinase